jgi:hypothetical protein
MATPDAARLSKAVIFNGSPILVTVRFSDSTGIPNLPDGSALANPHGMAIKFHVPDGGETDMVINSHCTTYTFGEKAGFLTALGCGHCDFQSLICSVTF